MGRGNRGINRRTSTVIQSQAVRCALAVTVVVMTLVSSAEAGWAACVPPDPDDLSFRQMIRRGTTGDAYFDRMIIGKVVTIRDPGEEGGKAVAVFAVAAHPTGFVPLVARVRFQRPPSNVFIEDIVNFKVGQHWVVIAHRKRDGSLISDGGCGQTRKVGTHRFRKLVGLARDLG